MTELDAELQFELCVGHPFVFARGGGGTSHVAYICALSFRQSHSFFPAGRDCLVELRLSQPA
jgi:hypothetical protein